MRENGIVGQAPKRKRPVTTQRAAGGLVAPNLLGQDFTASAPNQKWLADITYIDTAQGWSYLAPVLDLFARRIVGWAMADQHARRVGGKRAADGPGAAAAALACYTTPTRVGSLPAGWFTLCWPLITSRSA